MSTSPNFKRRADGSIDWAAVQKEQAQLHDQANVYVEQGVSYLKRTSSAERQRSVSPGTANHPLKTVAPGWDSPAGRSAESNPNTPRITENAGTSPQKALPSPPPKAAPQQHQAVSPSPANPKPPVVVVEQTKTVTTTTTTTTTVAPPKHTEAPKSAPTHDHKAVAPASTEGHKAAPAHQETQKAAPPHHEVQKTAPAQEAAPQAEPNIAELGAALAKAAALLREVKDPTHLPDDVRKQIKLFNAYDTIQDDSHHNGQSA